MFLTDLVKHTSKDTLQKKRLKQLSKIAQRIDTTRLALLREIAQDQNGGNVSFVILLLPSTTLAP
jgi:hypothetical protein